MKDDNPSHLAGRARVLLEESRDILLDLEYAVDDPSSRPETTSLSRAKFKQRLDKWIDDYDIQISPLVFYEDYDIPQSQERLKRLSVAHGLQAAYYIRIGWQEFGSMQWQESVVAKTATLAIHYAIQYLRLLEEDKS